MYTLQCACGKSHHVPDHLVDRVKNEDTCWNCGRKMTEATAKPVNETFTNSKRM